LICQKSTGKWGGFLKEQVAEGGACTRPRENGYGLSQITDRGRKGEEKLSVVQKTFWLGPKSEELASRKEERKLECRPGCPLGGDDAFTRGGSKVKMAYVSMTVALSGKKRGAFNLLT